MKNSFLNLNFRLTLIILHVCSVASFAQLDSAIIAFSKGRTTEALTQLNKCKPSNLTLRQQQNWWKLKYDCDYELGDIERAKSDANALQRLRKKAGLARYYQPEYLAMLGLCYHYQIRMDSAVTYTLKALDLFRKGKYKGDSLDAYRIYQAHASASRNQIPNYEKIKIPIKPIKWGNYWNKLTCWYIPAYFDTALFFATRASQYRNVTIAKIYKSYANFYADGIRIDPLLYPKEYSKWRFDKAMFYYQKACQQIDLSGNAHSYLMVVNQNLMGLANFYFGSFKKALTYLDIASQHINKFDIKTKQTAECLSSQLNNVFFKTLTFLDSLKANPLLYDSLTIALNTKEINTYLKYLQNIKSTGLPFRDIYQLNPLRRIINSELSLYYMTGETSHLSSAFYFINLNKKIADDFSDNRISSDTYNSVSNKDIKNYLKKIQGSLNVGNCILLFWDNYGGTFKEQTTAILISSNKISVQQIENFTSQSYKVNSFQGHPMFDQLCDSSAQSTNELLNTMTNKYYESIRILIPQNTDHLLLWPNQELSFVPYEILKDKPTGNYLMEKYKFSYLQSFEDACDTSLVYSKLNIMDNTIDSEGKVLFPFAHASAKQLTRYPRSKLTERINKQDFIKSCQQSGNIVQVFSHATSDANNLNKSFILFGNDSLTLEDMKNKAMQAALVSLVACEIDHGTYDMNGGKISLVPVFLRNGIKTVLSSQWLVDDKAGSIIAEEFYRQFMDGKSASESLRLAKIYLVKHYPGLSSPLYWSAFRLIGKDIRLEQKHDKLQLPIIILLILFGSIVVYQVFLKKVLK